MTEILCAAWSCWHDRSCSGEVEPEVSCDACRTPRRAADGLNLCTWHTRRLADNAVQAGQLAVDLDRLAGGSSDGDKVTTSREPGLTVNEAAMAARDTLRACLVGLCRLISEERGTGLPDDSPTAMAVYGARHATWLAAHPAAGEIADELEDVARDPHTWRVAYPASSDRRYIGRCPIQLQAGTCGTRLHWRRDAIQVTCGGCGTSASVLWWQEHIAGQAAAVVDAYAAAAHLSVLWQRPVEPRTVRQWSWRATGGLSVLREPPPDPDRPHEPGPIIRDRQGRTLLDLTEVVATATRRWGPPAERISA